MSQINGEKISRERLEIIMSILARKNISTFVIERVCNVDNIMNITKSQAYYLEIMLGAIYEG